MSSYEDQVNKKMEKLERNTGEKSKSDMSDMTLLLPKNRSSSFTHWNFSTVTENVQLFVNLLLSIISHVSVRIYMQRVHTYFIGTHTNTHAHTHQHKENNDHTQTHTDAYIHTYIHTCTQAGDGPWGTAAGISVGTREMQHQHPHHHHHHHHHHHRRGERARD
jgi:hypothetical protein